MGDEMKLISAEDLFYKPLDHKRTEQIVQGMIPLGLTVLAGAPKSGKSWLMLDIALAVSSGRSFFGKETTRCGVLYCALEDTEERLQARLLDLAEVPTEDLHFVKTCPRTDAGFQSSLRETLEQYPEIRLVIVDTLQKIRGTDVGKTSVNQYERDDEELSKLKRFADRNGIAIVLIHHLRKMKDKNDPLNEISGSTAISGTADTILVLQKGRNSPDARLIVTGRDLQQRELLLRFRHPRWELLEEKTEEQIRKERVPEYLYKVVKLVKEHGTWSGTATELLREIDETSINPSTCSAEITRFYHEVFAPEGIRIDYNRSSKRRERTFIYEPDDGHDAHDGDIDSAVEKTPSSPSLASLEELNARLETMFTMP